MNAFARLLACAALLAAPLAVASPAPAPARPNLFLASGQNSLQADGYTLHYNALPTTTLAPEMARRAGITRSANRALLNIALRKGRAAESTAVAVTLEVVAINPTGQRQALQMREVREGDAIYYLGEARIEERDTLRFEIVATPTDGGAPIRAVYAQEFWPAVPPR